MTLWYLTKRKTVHICHSSISIYSIPSNEDILFTFLSERLPIRFLPHSKIPRLTSYLEHRNLIESGLPDTSSSHQPTAFHFQMSMLNAKLRFASPLCYHHTDHHVSCMLIHCPRSSSYARFPQPCNLVLNFQFSSYPTLQDPMNCSTPGLPVHHHLPEFTQTHVHRVSDAIQPSHLCHPLLHLPPIPPSIRVFSNELTLHMRWAKVLEFQL